MTEKQFLRDQEFRKGFYVHGSTHEDGIVGTIFKKEETEPQWRLAQWACKYNIANGEKVAEEGIETPSQRVMLYEKEGERCLELRLLASKEYEAPRVEGQSWPHILIEQQLEKEGPSLADITSIHFQSEVMVEDWECKMDNPDARFHAAQANLFFTVNNCKTGDMYWFGIPYFDSRMQIQEAYMGEDGGKEDASHKFIYIIPQKRLTEKSFWEPEWIRYDRDILPDIVEGLDLAVKEGFLRDVRLEDYYLTTMNFGWEMPGTFDAALLIKQLSVVVKTK